MVKEPLTLLSVVAAGTNTAFAPRPPVVGFTGSSKLGGWLCRGTKMEA